MNARHGAGLFGADRENLRVRMRRAQDLEVQHSVHLHVSGVAGRAGDNGMSERILQAGATGVAGAVFFDVTRRPQEHPRSRGSRCNGRDCP